MKNLYRVSFFLFLLLACFVGMTLSGCVSQTPTPQYSENYKFAAAYIHDDTTALSSTAIAEEVSNALNNVLTDRNLKVTSMPFSAISSDMTSVRDTDRRLQTLRASANGAEFILLTEISTEFYSPLSGRYRWDVNVILSIYDIATRNTLTDKFTVPAVLMYSHENGDDAIQSVQSDLEKHIGSLVDAFLKGRTATPAPQAPTPPPAQAAPPKPAPIAAPPAPPVTPEPQMETPPASEPEPNTDPQEEAPLAGGASPAEAIYFILIDRFFNVQNSSKDIALNDPAGWHGGNLEGIRQKLPYLKKMGITKIWISPVFTAASQKFFGNAAFHAYWTYDLSSIDAHFGTEADLKQLAAEAKNYGIAIILDFVVNHVGYGSPLVENKPAWFHPALTIEDWNDPKQLTDRQVHGLPDLDQNNPEVYNYILNAAEKWIQIPNIAGLRLDAVKHVETSFWQKFNLKLRSERPNLILLGEYFDGDPKKVDDIQKAGKFTHMFDFPLSFALRDVFCDHKSLANLASVVTNDRQYNDANTMVTFLDNHDMPRFISICHQDKKAMSNALRVLLAWRGIPSLYYGTETPLAGDKEPDNRADMKFDQPEFYNLIQKSLELRRAYPVLAHGKTAVYAYKPGLLAIARQLGQQQAMILISTQNEPQTIELPSGKWFSPSDAHAALPQKLSMHPNTVELAICNECASMIDTAKRKITFKVPQDGATYALAGSAPELGNWNPAKAPKTHSEITIDLPSQTVIAYKPVKIGANGEYQWANGDNRELFVDRSDAIVNVSF